MAKLLNTIKGIWRYPRYLMWKELTRSEIEQNVNPAFAYPFLVWWETNIDRIYWEEGLDAAYKAAQTEARRIDRLWNRVANVFEEYTQLYVLGEKKEG